ncbi:molybdenum cofactor synthesis 2A [Oratosquilla oratoria]|uniref:molybdenum cofactor synthesis 2A n=1 Tax=Oratosquilla oratoria TaxID=337810 RepID=UPI003F768E64
MHKKHDPTWKWQVRCFERQVVVIATIISKNTESRQQEQPRYHPHAMSEGMCEVRLLFFAAARELAGTGEDTLTLPCSTTFEEVLQIVTKKFEDIIRIQDTIILSLNQEYCERNQPLSVRSGDELAIIPPISGGLFISVFDILRTC